MNILDTIVEEIEDAIEKPDKDGILKGNYVVNEIHEVEHTDGLVDKILYCVGDEDDPVIAITITNLKKTIEEL